MLWVLKIISQNENTEAKWTLWNLWCFAWNSFIPAKGIYLYKEDFANFKDGLIEVTDFIIKEKGEDVISAKKETHSEEIKQDSSAEESPEESTEESFQGQGKERQHQEGWTGFVQ